MQSALKKTFFWLVILLHPVAYAQEEAVDLGHSYIIFSNNTSQTLSVKSAQVGEHQLSQDNWGIISDVIGPYETKKVLWFSRYSGVKTGKDYYFQSTLSSKKSALVLKQKLTGKPTHTELAYRVSGPDFDTPWYTDRSIHTLQSPANANALIGLSSGSSLHVYDDIQYVIHENFDKPNLGGAQRLDVISYNLFLMPFGLSADQKSRAKSLPSALSGYDIAILSEALDTTNSPIVLNQLLAEYPYQSQIVATGTFINGGSVVLSKWPIELEKEHVYVNRNLETYDALANKGVKYVRINKLGQVYHVFATHTHAWSTQKSIDVRWKQLEELAAFIQEQAIPADEPVLLGGDLNVDKLLKDSNQEYYRALALLQVDEPTYSGFPYSFDPATNYYVTSEQPEYLDYVFNLKGHKQPYLATNTVQPIRAFNGLQWGKWDLSDHYPLIAHFEF